MSRLFDHDLVYPSDNYGPYVELEGKVVLVSHSRVDVEVEGHGGMTGYSDFIEARPETAPRPGYIATIRVYDAGGGWYPDNRIMGWRHE